MKLKKTLYYFCRRGKNPPLGKIRACCSNGCPHLGTRPRKQPVTRGVVNPFAFYEDEAFYDMSHLEEPDFNE
jgi:hypothetical protein